MDSTGAHPPASVLSPMAHSHLPFQEIDLGGMVGAGWRRLPCLGSYSPYLLWCPWESSVLDRYKGCPNPPHPPTMEVGPAVSGTHAVEPHGVRTRLVPC